ncbi:hypothetical protein J19TS2_25350 [Cohnella xylanilytica]|nr:LuxR C-terminal-related transcriptional regulator [Cohnella xylanilytica]GIO12980.1 hypothetical protein J19TS2_25350 [Cohnella xylanilytica]
MAYNRQLQQLQDTYATAYRMAIAIVDHTGRMTTEPSGSDGLLARVLSSTDGFDLRAELKRHTSYLQGIQAVTIYDYNTIYGLKFLVAPLRVREGYSCFVWAGAWMDEQSRKAAADAFDIRKRGDSETLRHLRELPDIGELHRMDLMTKLGQMAEIAAVLLRNDTENRGAPAPALRRLREVVDWSATPGFADREADAAGLLLRILELDVAGFARKVENERFQVAFAAGDDRSEALLGAAFHTGEGCLGHVALIRRRMVWSSSSEDPRFSFFSQRGLDLRTVVGYPLTAGGEMIGILFGGTFSFREPPAESVELIELMMSLWGSGRQAAALQEKHQQHRLLLRTLNEIAYSIGFMHDANQVLSVLVDAAHSLVGGSFACILLLPEPDRRTEARLVSREMGPEQIHQYAREAAERYRPRKDAPQTNARQPIGRLAEWGESIVELPLVHGRQIVGVLALGIAEERLKEAERLLVMALAMIGEMRLFELRNADGLARRSHLELLGQAVAKWNPAAYREAAKTAKLAADFAHKLGFEPASIERIGQAGLVSAYESSYLWETVPWNADVIRVLQESEEILKRLVPVQADERAPPDYSREAQVLALARWQSRREQSPHALPAYSSPAPALIEETLVEAFEGYMRENLPLASRISLDDLSPDPAQPETSSILFTPREKEVLDLMIQGYTNQDIAEHLFISAHTVKNHLTKIYMKLGVGDRAGAMLKMLRPDSS